jgi:hypothetical protein
MQPPKMTTKSLSLPPLTVEWDERHRLCLFIFGGVWTWHDCRDGLQTAAYMRDEHKAAVNYVYDFTSSRLPPRLFQDQVKKLLLVDLHPRPVKIILVGQEVALQVLLETMRRLYTRELHPRIEIVENVARARTLSLSLS